MNIGEHPQIANALRYGYPDAPKRGLSCDKCGWQPDSDEDDSLWRDNGGVICGTCLEEELKDLPLEDLAQAFGCERIG